jgi:hypothetical protein
MPWTLSYDAIAIAICRRFDTQLVRRDASRAACTAGISSAASKPTMPMTTRSSISEIARLEQKGLGHCARRYDCRCISATFPATVAPIMSMSIYADSSATHRPTHSDATSEFVQQASVPSRKKMDFLDLPPKFKLRTFA